MTTDKLKESAFTLPKWNKSKPYRTKKRGRIIGTITALRKGQIINGEKLIRGSLIECGTWSQSEYWFETK